MNFEVLKKNHLKRNILMAIGVVLILSALILTFTRAKYRTTQSMPLLQGTINFSPYDFNVVAMYLNKGDETITTKKAPHVGYTLNTDQSTCVVDDAEVNNGQILFENGNLTFQNMNYSGTRCSVYFDLIPDSENPVLNNIYFSTDDTSITVTAIASDNVGIYYYYYKLDSEKEVRADKASYTFEGLTKDDIHTISVRVEDAAGNISETQSKEVAAGYSPSKYILANEGGAPAIEGKGTPNFATVATTDEGMYAAEDDLGTSYYYRGAIQDNWVQFGTNASGQPLYWRIIRINGDGTIRLIYNGTSTETTGTNTQFQTSILFNSAANNNAYVGYMYQSGQVHGLQQSSTIKGVLDIWYQQNLADEADYIEGGTGFCGDRQPSTSTSSSNGSGGTGTTTTYYGAYIRLITNKAPVLTCTNDSDLYTTSGSSNGNKALTYPIGLITADEVTMAGGVYGIANQSYYLYTDQYYWTMSPFHFGDTHANLFRVDSDGKLRNNSSSISGVRPVINIRSDIQITGSGTTSDPFVVVTS